MAKELDDDYRSEIDKVLDEFEKQAGLPEFKKIECPAYLTMALEDLRKKSPDQLSEAVFEIAQYSLYIQRLINRNKAWQRWALSRIDEIAASELPNIGTNYGFNERVLIAKNSPELCKRINAFLRKTEMQLNRLYGVPDNIKFMADCIRDMKFAAIRKEKGYQNAE
jgi:hypothetical protein